MIGNRRPLGPALLVSFGLAFVMLQPASAGNPNLNVRTGLWEMTTVAQTSGAPPVDLSNLTPEQRAKVEAMMGSIMKSAAMPHTIHTCVTQEKLAKSPFEDLDKGGACKRTIVAASATALDVRFECTQERQTTSGEWRFEAATPELLKGSGHMTIERAGKKMESTSSVTAKWVGASCGNVK